MLKIFCTLCANHKNCPLKLLNIADLFCEESKIDDLIPKYLHIDIQSDFLCVECLKQLVKFHEYYKNVHDSQKKILILLTVPSTLSSFVSESENIKSSQTIEEQYVNCLKEESHEIIDEIIEQLIQSEQSDENENDCKKIIIGIDKETNYLGNNVKQEEDENAIEHFNNKEKSDGENETGTKRKRYTKKNTELINIEQKTENRISFMTPEDFKNVNYDADKDLDSKISNFMDLSCAICNEKFPTFNRIMRHHHNTHQMRGFISCCDLKFYTRIELVDHIDCNHLNSDRLKCHLCGKKLGNTRSLRRHMINIHRWKKEELYPCDICPNISFSKRVDLKKHKFETHTTNSYICMKCKRTFKSEGNLLFHEENIHNRKPPSSLVCDLCGKIFKTSGGFYKHTKEVHEGKVKRRQECNICGSLVKKLEYHKRMAHPPEGTVIKCKECNKEMKTWFALKSHRANVHRIDKRKFLCDICDKGFKNKKLLLEHNASHTGQPLYTCTYCPTTFKHESNYLKHKKRQHTNEWAEEKRLKYLSLKDK